MEDIELIETWLTTGKNYQIGYEIYRRIGKNSLLKSVLKTEDDWNKTELEERLVEILENLLKAGQKQVLEPNREKVQEILSNEMKKPSDRSDAPKEIVETVKRRKYLYATRKDAHSKLKALKHTIDPELLEQKRLACKLIIDGAHEIKKLWDITNYYDKNLRLPENTVEVEIKFRDLDTASLTHSWMIDYKYIKKNIGKANLASNVKQRILDCKARELILTERDSFIYSEFSLPEIE